MYTSPNFIIIGAQRCGTTSLYSNLIRQPFVVGAKTKEIHFFDLQFQKGTSWYKKHFPNILREFYTKLRYGFFSTGEASPYYIFHPHVPKRIKKFYPDVKLIILLRNPVDRAYSHYNLSVRQKFEKLSFAEIIKREESNFKRWLNDMLEDDSHYSFSHQRYTYLSRGIYIDQIKSWKDIFSDKQMLILRSEDYYENPKIIIKQCLGFLGIPDNYLSSYDIKYSPPINKKYTEMNSELRKYLINYYKPYNKKLYEYLGRDFLWDK